MSHPRLYELKIDQEFKSLIPPLSVDERAQLEENLISEGCREPLSVWRNTILDGHNRYEICTRNKIPFRVMYVNVSSREEAIVWICSNQLGRRNITIETRKYLIGKRFEAEKQSGAKNAKGYNQYKPNDTPEASKRRTAERIGQEYHISHATVDKYGIYAHAIDVLTTKEPAIVPKILSGQVKISHENIVELARLSAPEVKQLSRSISSEEADYICYSDTRRGIQKGMAMPPPQKVSTIPTASIKDMPQYDPDAEISSLALTIPSWVSSIDRTMTVSDLATVSENARERLRKQLVDLKETINDMLNAMKEDNDG